MATEGHNKSNENSQREKDSYMERRRKTYMDLFLNSTRDAIMEDGHPQEEGEISDDDIVEEDD